MTASYTCLEFRRAKLADPGRLPAQARSHALDCPGCRDFARRIDAAEHDTARVLEVPVPDGLAERVILQARARAGQPAWRLGALAASVVLSVLLGMATWLPAGQQDYARFAIEHVLHEADDVINRRLADTKEFGTVLARFGGELQAPIGKVRYMKLCPVPGGTGWHVVIDTEHGPATLLLIPAARGTAERLEAEMKGLMAMARPGGDGYYAVVTESRESLEAISGMLNERVSWQI